MPLALLWIPLLIAILDWVAVAKNWRRLEYLAKPGAMLALLGWLWQMSQPAMQAGVLTSRPLIYFASGVIFSLAGDILLMLPRESFIGGLVAFLLAHLAYVVGFNTTLPPLNLFTPLIVLLVGASAAWLYRRIAAGLTAKGGKKLKKPVAAYAAVISLMALSALLTLTRPQWAIGHALLASTGALLFFASDSLLAWNRFVSPLPHGRLQVMVTYHLGQIALVTGAALHFLS